MEDCHLANMFIAQLPFILFAVVLPLLIMLALILIMAFVIWAYKKVHSSLATGDGDKSLVSSVTLCTTHCF